MNINLPLEDSRIKEIRAGEIVYLSGLVYTARDAAHKRMAELLERGEDMPFDFKKGAVYYAGPCPSREGRIIGSIGPTTSGRMDLYSPLLMSKGLKVMIGKGERSPEVIEAIKSNRGIYFAAIGGAGALMSKCVTSAKVIAFEDLGTEAIRELRVENLPVVVAVDSYGDCVYK